MKYILYRILKKDMIKRMRNAHRGEQFIDDVMEIFGIPTNFMREDNRKMQDHILEAIEKSHCIMEELTLRLEKLEYESTNRMFYNTKLTEKELSKVKW